MKKINFLYGIGEKRPSDLDSWYFYSVRLLIVTLLVISIVQVRQIYNLWMARKACTYQSMQLAMMRSMGSKLQKLQKDEQVVQQQFHIIQGWMMSHNSLASLLAFIIKSFDKDVSLCMFHWHQAWCELELKANSIAAALSGVKKISSFDQLKKLKPVSFVRQGAYFQVKMNGLANLVQ